MADYHVVIIGGGGTGGALAHDLTLRGIKVTLVERGELTSGTTGRHHGLLHSGARYAVKDRESARECIEENIILRRIAPGSFEENDGLFVAVADGDMAYSQSFIDGCLACDIPIQQLSKAEALRHEPLLSPDLIMAVRVPDASFDAMRLPLRFFATAKHNGAELLTYTEVIGVLKSGSTVTGIRVIDHRSRREYDISADIVVNAAGPWGGKVAAFAGVDVPVTPSPGVMLAVRGRLSNMVINRMTSSGDGDIIVPQRALSIIGTSSWVVDDPDDLGLPEDHIEAMVTEGAMMIPAVRSAEHRAAWSAARPLLGHDDSNSGRDLSRTFECFDHETDGADGFFTITGGKATTLRGMAELTSDRVAAKLGVDAPCTTRDVVLLPHTTYYG